MATGRAPNHPVNISGLFETLDVSVPDNTRANQYGNVTTPSCVSCAGIDGTTPEFYELSLTANTALNNLLEPTSTYFLSGRLLAPNDGSTPVLTYQPHSAVRNGPAGPTAPDFTNKVNVIGLGLVTGRQEVVSPGDDTPAHLEVTVEHSDWDSIQRAHRSFTVRYIVPGTKIFIKTHGLYLVGRELEITGNLVDFNMTTFTAVVAVTSVAVTTGHQLGRGTSLTSSSPSGAKGGKKFNKFSPSKGPSVDSSKTHFTPPNPTPASSSCGPSSPLDKGKGKADDVGEDSFSDGYDSDAPIVNGPSSSASNKRVRPTIVKDAAKRLKNQ
ncbi:hypothetical protein Pst134EB_004050 [Puccinia striiformis f. sp. tritici]|uniref:Uncharacterized protein n=2 Tax=Puccinia striiformis f. sp. tritici TaxID=168172 RepID=A0A0L0W489_9BASI|nr:hypothetical protein Pst134EB_004050 [Puccinia striiformis f. sp. tritici]KNF06358.1 hypothetical protein PSTG_00242 [Puccinia striiformis f. sp. tritici PST-78]